jgi:hypothetical protein
MRKALWLVIPVALGAAIAGGWHDIIRFAKIKQISLGSGHPEVVPAEGTHAYGHSRPSGEPDFDSARRGGPALLVPLGPARHDAGSRKAGARVADARGRDASRGMARGATTVDSRTALVERATHAEPLSWSKVC